MKRLGWSGQRLRSSGGELGGPRIRLLSKALVEEIRMHNVHAFCCAVIAFAIAAVLWSVLYCAVCWFGVLYLTIAHDQIHVELPQQLPKWYLAIAIALTFAAALDRFVTVDERVVDSLLLLGTLLDCLLFLPRTTLDVWGNLTALIWFGRDDLRLASWLVGKVACEKELEISHTPLDHRNQRRFCKVVSALILARILDTRIEKGSPVLRLSPLRPESLTRPQEYAIEDPDGNILL